jgi:UDP-N-acetylmuramoyl-tripeptide--D-alanyl-D-alanine ligase
VSPSLWAAALSGLMASGLAGVRWLRVAQREHYLASAGSRFALRWWGGIGFNRLLWVLAVLALLVSLSQPAVEVVTAAVVAVGPLGLGLRGRTAKLAWTARLRRLAAIWALVELVALTGATVLGVEVGGGAALIGLFTLGVPSLVDLACALAAPLERRLVAPFVRRAAERLARVGPTVVAITGSYGKTSTKGYVAHLVGTTRSVVPSPASYNNRAGLARAVNENLVPGTEVFVAEMGTYGKGEIAELCSWTHPKVSVITAIGPVHLERFGSEERIVEAKSEILAGAEVAVLNVDDPRLAAVAGRAAASGKRVWRCSGSDPSADVFVGPIQDEMASPLDHAPLPGTGAGGPMWAVLAEGRPLGRVRARPEVAPTNVACAVAVGLELGVPEDEVGRLLPTLPVAAHRLAPLEGSGGFAILDDTYNSNPAGARMALAALASLNGSGTGRRVLVTPGMVELGKRQAQENQSLAALAREVVSDLVIVGHTNRRALLAGVRASARAAPVAVGAGPARPLGDPGPEALSGPQVVLVANREEAVAWVRQNLGAGDAVLYENDLPDHFP